LAIRRADDGGARGGASHRVGRRTNRAKRCRGAGKFSLSKRGGQKEKKGGKKEEELTIYKRTTPTRVQDRRGKNRKLVWADYLMGAQEKPGPSKNTSKKGQRGANVWSIIPSKGMSR